MAVETKATQANLPSLAKIPAATRKAKGVEVVDEEYHEIEVDSSAAYVIRDDGGAIRFLPSDDIVDALPQDGDSEERLADYWKFDPRDKSFKGGPWPMSIEALGRVSKKLLSLTVVAKPKVEIK